MQIAKPLEQVRKVEVVKEGRNGGLKMACVREGDTRVLQSFNGRRVQMKGRRMSRFIAGAWCVMGGTVAGNRPRIPWR